MNMEFTTINNIASDIYSHKLMRDLPFERIIADTLELIQITGCPNLFETKEEVLEIKNWRTMLPCDYYQINQLVTEEGHFKTFLESTDTFSPVGTEHSGKLVYRIQGRVLYTSMKEGKVRLSYEAIKLDKDGFPMIINNASFIRALKSYIKMNWFTMLFDEGRIKNDVLANAQQEYYGNIAQAQNSLIMPDLAQMNNIAAIYNSVLTNDRSFMENYHRLNEESTLRIH